MELASSQPYANFRAWVPRNLLSVGHITLSQWLCYDWGPRAYPEPVICLHSLIGSAESFFHQVIQLASLGYRVLSIQIPVYWSVPDFCDALHTFLETLSIRRAHFYGAGVGGFLALHYAARRPERVASLILTHSFLSTDNFSRSVPYSLPVLKWLPDFLVRTTVRAMLPKGRTSIVLANAAEFAIGNTMQCNRETLASRIALSMSTKSVADRIAVPEQNITLIDTLDRSVAALKLSETTASLLPHAKRALLNFGADFPYLSAPEEVNVHLIVHLRRNAPSPKVHITIPPPARPHPLPTAVLRRRKERANESKESSADGEIKEKDEASFAQEQSIAMEKISADIPLSLDYLPGKDDAALTVVLPTADGDVDLPESKTILEGS